MNAIAKSESKSFLIATIGTCRIADPILTATRHRPLRRANQRVYGFVHTLPEILQQIDDLLGVRPIPSELEPFLTDRIGASKGDVDEQPDLYLVEVSTRKELRFRDWVLQVNYVERTLKPYPGLHRIFRNRWRQSDRAERRDLLLAHPEFERASEIERAVLLETYVHQTTYEELEAGLHTIKEKLSAPVIFFCHIDVDDFSGRPLASRRELCAWMRQICERNAYPFIDPTPHVVAFGREQALDDGGKDVNHYSLSYKRHYGCLLFDLLSKKPGSLFVADTDSWLDPVSVEPPEVVSGSLEGMTEPMPGDKVPPAPASGASDGAENRVWGFIRRGDVAPAVLDAETAAIELARQHLSKGRLDLAELSLLKVPASEPIRTMQGEIAMRRGDMAGAEKLLREALAMAPLAIPPKILLVRLLLTSGRASDAAGYAAELMEEAPRDARALSLCVKVMAKVRRFDDAAVANLLAADIEPRDPLPLVEAARYWSKAKAFDRAVDAAESALRRAPEDAGAHVQLIEALARLRRPAELQVALRAGAPFAPELVVRHLDRLGDALDALEVGAMLVAARKAKPDLEIPAAPLNSVTRRLIAAGRGAASDQDALPIWQVLRGLDPGSKQAVLGIRKIVTPIIEEARRHATAGEFAEAAAAYRRALEVDALNMRLQREFAVLLEKAADWAGAVARWELISNDIESAAEALARGARAARNASMPLHAIKFYLAMPVEAREEHAGGINSVVKGTLALLRADFTAGEYEAAAIKAVAILGLDPEHQTAQRLRDKSLAMLARQMREAKGQDAEQLAVARRILAVDPNREDALRVLNRATGRKRAASKVEQQAEGA